MKKADLETSLDEYLSENASRLSSNPKLAPYYSGRSKNVASPVKKEAPVKEADDKAAIKVTKRKSKSADDG